MIRNPWMVNIKPKPMRHTEVSSATTDIVAKWRSKVVRRALSTENKTADWEEKRRLDCEIKRIFRKKAHLRRQVIFDNLRK